MKLKHGFFTYIVILATELLCMAILVLLTFNTLNKQHLAAQHLNELIDHQHITVQLADQLRQSSDDLTRMVRTYAVTGNPLYKEYFYNILDIRDGLLPRPERYEYVFWDFVIPTGKKLTFDKGRKISLPDLMQKEGFTEKELALLVEAKKRSDMLVNLEETAMNALDGRFRDESGAYSIRKKPDREMALGILFGDEYHRTKKNIMDPINQVIIASEKRTRGALSAFQKKNESYCNTLTVLFGGLITAVPLFILTLYRYFRSVQDERKRSFEELNKSEQRLLQIEKLDALGQLAGGIAHDFNNQLAAIMGYADILKMKLEDPELEKYADNIMLASLSSSELTKQLLAFARKGQYQKIPVDLHKTISEVILILRHSIDKRIQISKHLDANAHVTTGDPSQLQNAFLNLAINARDAMPDGGELIFQTEETVLNEEYCNDLPYEIKPGQYILVSVTDSGCGMDKETQKRIFEPFFTTKEVGKGTGMGLASVYGTVKHHMGAINVYSELKSGTTFNIYLPLTPTKEEKKSRKRNAAYPEKLNARVLIVDDEKQVRELTREILSEAGCSVTTCSNGAEAIAWYYNNWKETDLVILDMVMPAMDGRDAYQAMKKVNPDIKAILSSGFSINGRAGELLAKGVHGFIQKPFRKEKLLKMTQEVLQLQKLKENR